MLNYDSYTIVVLFISFAIAISVHEFSHAGMLYLLGDRSGKTRARLTLRPDVHFKWWGVLLMLFTGLIIGNPVFIDEDRVIKKFGFGWALFFTKLAGPFSNLVTAAIMLLVVKYYEGYQGIDECDFYILIMILKFIAYVNVYMFTFNMLPFPMLDGGVVLLILSLKLKIELPVIIIGYILLIAFIALLYFCPNFVLVKEYSNLQNWLMERIIY